jgi:hypothetical protein|tara:strand:- start:635 stop:907 length:273 start_codon:yes stop_codon:yes gene_type:complete
MSPIQKREKTDSLGVKTGFETKIGVNQTRWANRNARQFAKLFIRNVRDMLAGQRKGNFPFKSCPRQGQGDGMKRNFTTLERGYCIATPQC